MITSRKRRRWVIPKGVKEPELSPQDSAAKEALEEAGIKGAVTASSLGSYQYEKWGATCTVQVYLMEVETVLDKWLESFRDREWVSVATAAERVTEDELKSIIRRVPGLLSHDAMEGVKDES